MSAPAESERVAVYGKLDCVDTQRSRALLERLGVPYQFHDVIADTSDAERARLLSRGSRVPVIRLPDGTIAVEPSDEHLADALRRAGATD